jgi:hypothetical protein
MVQGLVMDPTHPLDGARLVVAGEVVPLRARVAAHFAWSLDDGATGHGLREYPPGAHLDSVVMVAPVPGIRGALILTFPLKADRIGLDTGDPSGSYSGYRFGMFNLPLKRQLKTPHPHVRIGLLQRLAQLVATPSRCLSLSGVRRSALPRILALVSSPLKALITQAIWMYGVMWRVHNPTLTQVAQYVNSP